MTHAIAAARALGYPLIVLVGVEPYYVRVGFARLAPGRIKFPGPVDPARVLGLSLAQQNVMLTIKGEVRRPYVDHPVCADGAPVAL